MTHRAEQIVDSVAGILRSWTPSTINIFKHRRLSLGNDEGELPAITVDFGEDSPVDDDGSYLTDGTIQSLLTLNITGVAEGLDEEDLRKTLLQLRTFTHLAIKKMPQIELPFVIDVHYGGANPPEVDVSGDVLIGELTSQWGVRYELNLNNPE